MKTAYSVLDENNLKTTFVFFFYYLVFALIGLVSYILLKNIYVVLSLIIFAFLYNLFFLFKGDKITAFIFKAKEIKKEDNPEIYNLVENVSITAGLPKTPKIYLIDTKEMNAFAYGTSYKNYLICLTTGLIEKLDKKELEAVIAHEISHIKNKDTRTMTVAVFLAGVIYLISDIIIRALGESSSKNDENKNSSNLYILVGALLILAPIFASIITFAISRKREFAADASAALLTRDPLALASALKKIATSDHNLFKSESSQASLAYTPLFIVDPNKEFPKPLSQNFSDNQKIKKEKWNMKKLNEFIEWLVLFSLCILTPLIILIAEKDYLILGILIGIFISAFISSKLYDTHPPIEERIEILEKMVI
ncbi:Protease HtpX [bacterium HR35]|nr:Protease HtpX [bacterium HR35]